MVLKLTPRHIWAWTLLAIFYVLPVVLLGVAVAQKEWFRAGLWGIVLAVDIVFVAIGRSTGLFDIEDWTKSDDADGDDEEGPA